MDETAPIAAPEPPRAPRVIERAAKILAVFGGMIALAVAAMVVVSVLRRWLFSSPVPGDFELAQIGTAVAVFAFLPYCQIVRGNIVVDTFTAHLRARLLHRIDGLWDLVYAAAMALVAACLARGTWDMMDRTKSRWCCAFRPGPASRSARSAARSLPSSRCRPPAPSSGPGHERHLDRPAGFRRDACADRACGCMSASRCSSPAAPAMSICRAARRCSAFSRPTPTTCSRPTPSPSFPCSS